MVAPLMFSLTDPEASPTVVARVGTGIHPDGLPQVSDSKICIIWEITFVLSTLVKKLLNNNCKNYVTNENKIEFENIIY